MNLKKFKNTIKKFHKIEDARDQLWDRARNLIENGFEVEAYILILATWNFAGFRYSMKIFDLKKFQNVIKEINPVFKKHQDKKFENIDFTNNQLISDISYIYSQLKQIAKQTGATKIMALKNPKLFVMWDTEIRRMYHIPNEAEPHDYIEFLKKMKDGFGHFKNSLGKEYYLAKAIDEYNYVQADNIRKKRREK